MRVFSLGLALAIAGGSLSAQVTDDDVTIVTDEYGNAEVTTIDPSVVSEIWADAFAQAGPGRQLFIEGDFAAALEVLRPIADAGNPVAQNIVGVLLTENQGPLTEFYDVDTGVAYLFASADQGFPLAMHNLGEFYTEDHGDLAPDAAQSYGWFRAAAELGYVEAYYDVGYALANGEGTEEDFDEARRFLDLAMEGSEAAAALAALGDLAYYGAGEPENLTKALELFVASAEAGDAYGAYSAGWMHYFGEGTDIDDPLAVAYLEQARAGGEHRAIGLLVEAHRYGYGLPQDPIAAAALAEEGIAAGNQRSMEQLADMLFQAEVGTRSEADIERARDLARQAYDLGSGEGAYLLGEFAYYGLGEPENFAKAYGLYEETLERSADHLSATYSIGYMKMRGLGTDTDLEGAAEMITGSAANGLDWAQAQVPLLFGDPAYAGDHSDPVLALAACRALVALEVTGEPWTWNGTDVLCASLEDGAASVDADALAAETLRLIAEWG